MVSKSNDNNANYEHAYGTGDKNNFVMKLYIKTYIKIRYRQSEIENLMSRKFISYSGNCVWYVQG